MKIGIMVKPNQVRALPLLLELISFLEDTNLEFSIDKNGSLLLGKNYRFLDRDEIPKNSDLIIVLGGDGTFLAAARHSHSYDIPIMGVNLGRVGFLTEIPSSEMIENLKLFLEGKAKIGLRMMLKATLFRNNEKISTYHCLNDTVINKSALARIIYLSVSSTRGQIADIFADGIIVSTPTGSTAYNLAAQGPIVTPDMEAIILTPLCPQILSLRPLILPPSETIEIKIKENSEEVFLTADGQKGISLNEGDLIKIEKSENRLKIIENPKMGYFSLLSEKLGWAKK